jgi:membrane protease YdiL (CAAX protease family)
MVRRALLACGVISSVLYVAAIDVLAPIVDPSYYSYTSQMVSELFALGAPTRAFLFLPMVLYNLLVFAFGAGVWASAGGRRARALTAAALMGYGACSTAGLLITPMELRGAGVSEQTLLHIWGTVLQGVFIALVLVCGAFVHGARFRLYSFATLGICVVFGALASFEAALASMRWIGLTERVNIYAWMLWLAVLALSLLPTRVPVVASPDDARPPHRLATIGLIAMRRPVLTYFVVTLAISWGGFLLASGSGLLAGASWQTDPRFMAAVSAMLAGPPVAGILLTVIVSGQAGLRDLLSRLLAWRVGGRWYAVALLLAPISEIVVLLALSRISQAFLPSIVTADDKAALLVSGVAIGLVGGLVEELGWTGFAIPRLTPRYGVLGTGLIVGPMWGVWHLLQMWWVGSTSSDGLPLGLFLPVFFLSSVVILTAYRVLMTWVYDHTGSLLVAILMHASYIFTSLFVLAPPTTGVFFLTYSAVFAAALWGVVAMVAVANGWHLSRRPLQTGAGGRGLLSTGDESPARAARIMR